MRPPISTDDASAPSSLAALPFSATGAPRSVPQSLSAIRKQLELLQESLSALYALPPSTPYPDILARFQILNLRYEAVQDEISRSNLRDAVAFPGGFDEVDPEFPSRVLLRTKLIPEIEGRMDEVKKRAREEVEKRGGDVEQLAQAHDSTATRALAFLAKYSRSTEEGEEYRADLLARLELPPALARGKIEPRTEKKELEGLLRFMSSGVVPGTEKGPSQYRPRAR